MPSPQEHRRGDGTNTEGIDVFRQQEHGKLDAAVLGVIAGHDLRLALWQVEGSTIHLRDGGREIEDEGQGLKDDEGQSPLALGLHDGDHGQGTNQQQHAHDRQDHGDLVADHLGHRAHAAQE